MTGSDRFPRRPLVAMALLMLAWVALGTGVAAQSSNSTEAVAERFRDALLARDFEALAAIYAADVLFQDQTAGAFEPELAAGIRGSDAVIAKERSWGENEAWTFEIDRQFASGSHGLFQGTLTIPGFGTYPFMTVIRVVDGRITERQDYGDYSTMTATVHAQPDHDLGRIARAWMSAYAPGHFDAWAELAAPEIAFRDSSAGDFWEGVEYQTGPEALIRQFNQAVPPGAHFVVTYEDSFFAPGVAVMINRFETDAVMEAGAEPRRYEGPLFTVLQIAEGRVQGHRDYWDAQGYAEAMSGAN